MSSRASFAASQKSWACSRRMDSSRTVDPSSVTGVVISSGVTTTLMVDRPLIDGFMEWSASLSCILLQFGTSQLRRQDGGLAGVLTCDDLGRPTVCGDDL